ncbi:MAG: cytochrome C [Acidobacteria bacterium]|nr:MAG: cytochrome C [Acidobacteriota bacterium]
MRKIFKILGLLLVTIFSLAACFLAFLFIHFPKTEPAAQIKIESTPARLARGEYLFHHVVGCDICHSVRNFEIYGGPMTPGTEGAGGHFGSEEGLGTLYAPNITPYALASWSDGEIERALTSGVNKAGEPLFPIMPYERFARLSQEDLYSIIVYLKTQKPITNNVPRSRIEFPLSLIMRTIPEPAHPQANPKFAHRGEYLANAASCIECHTPHDDHGKPIPGMMLAGGFEFHIPNHGTVRSVNLTPDPETGIGKWTKEDFVSRFERFASPEASNIAVAKGSNNTVMPWFAFAGMSHEDLSDIYDFLRTVKPIKHSVEKFGK